MVDSTANKIQRMYREVRELQSTFPDDAPVKQRGFAILYAPPRVGRLLVMGLNPSRMDGSYASRHPEAQEGPPDCHLYEDRDRGGKLGERMRSLANGAVSSEHSPVWDTLIEGNKANFLFFGSKNETEWQSPAFWGSGWPELRKNVELECHRWVAELLEILRPPAILLEGIKLWDRLESIGGQTIENEPIYRHGRRNNHRLIRTGIHVHLGEHRPVFAMCHPTGARAVTVGERDDISKSLSRWVHEYILK